VAYSGDRNNFKANVTILSYPYGTSHLLYEKKLEWCGYTH